MTHDESNNFLEQVWKMRCAQKAYFKRPIIGRLIHAKCLEKLVDEQLDREQGYRDLPFSEPPPIDEVPY